MSIYCPLKTSQYGTTQPCEKECIMREGKKCLLREALITYIKKEEKNSKTWIEREA